MFGVGVRFECDGGELVVWGRGDRQRFRGRVDGAGVLDAFGLSGTTDGIVVLDWTDRPPGVLEWHVFANVLRVDRDGEVVWRAEPPHGEARKSWTTARLVGDALMAWTWESRCELDPATGAIRSSEFTT